MAYLPTLTESSTTRDATDTFSGYNHNLKISDGEFYDTQNLTSVYYPLLASRAKRGTVRTFTKYQGIATLNGKLAWVDDGTLYYGGTATTLTGLSDGMKQLITTGAYICVFPDGYYYNTVDPEDSGPMNYGFSTSGYIEYHMCDSSGEEYGASIASETAPEDPEDGDTWINTTESKLYQYSSSSSMWIGIQNVYTKIIFPAMPVGQRPMDIFKEYDGVSIAGAYPDDLNGTKVIYGVGVNYIVIVGIAKNNYSHTAVAAPFTITASVPKMDYVLECQNRIWGCYYGTDDDGETINEIYCCALGDFKNWNRFIGLSTDSYVASVGTDGPWTGAINYLGYPTFFKENYIHTVTVSGTGAHSIANLPCRGLQSGSAKSLVICNEYLLYKSADSVCSYQGSFPTAISDKLGDVKYFNAAGGSFGDRYYMSCCDSDGIWSLFTADITKGIWIREDDLHVLDFIRCGNELYAVTADGELLALLGTEGTLENRIDWYAETGILYYEYPDKKYVSRFNIRMQMETEARLQIYIEYDSDGIWRECGKAIYFTGTGTVNVPVRPRRCDHMKIRLVGAGDAKIFSIARVLEVGSDY